MDTDGATLIGVRQRRERHEEQRRSSRPGNGYLVCRKVRGRSVAQKCTLAGRALCARGTVCGWRATDAAAVRSPHSLAAGERGGGAPAGGAELS